MARIALICAIVLWGVCKGYEIHESEGSSTVVPKYKCPSDGMFAYPPDCTRYIKCYLGYYYIMPCPEGLHFSRRYRSCAIPSEARCSPTINEVYSTEYPFESTEYTTDVNTDKAYTERTESPVSQKVKFRCLSDGLFAYPPDCTRFIQCSNGRPFVMNCPEGLHFSKRISRCDYPCNAQCNPAISKECEENKKVNEACSLPPKKGQCKSYVIRYYYDTSEGKCKKFVFGGCYGNANNFKSEKQCLEVCGQSVDKDTTTQDSTDAYPTSDPWGYSRLHSQESTDVSWTSEEDASSPIRDSVPYPSEIATKTTEDYPSYSTDIGHQEPSEDSRVSFMGSEVSWGSDSDQPTNGQSPKQPDENVQPDEDDSEWISTERTSTAYSFKARVVGDFQCGGRAAYSNPDDCSSFIWCPLDRAIVVPCPPNTHYSEQRDECVDPCLAHCNISLACSCGWPECHQYNLIDCESDPDAGPCPDRELRYFYDRERGRCKSFYYGGCHGNGNNFRTLRECQRECQTSLLAGFRCPSYNGDFGHYPDCVSYYQCKRGIPTLKRCPKGTAFHHLKAKCVPEEEAMCVYECREPNAVYPAPKDCRSYIDCVNGIPRLEKCPRGLAFDVNKRNCVLERSTSCTW